MFRLLQSLNVVKYRKDALVAITAHLENLRTSLAAAELKFIIKPPEDVLVGDHTFSSDIVLKVLGEMSKNATVMQTYLAGLQLGNVPTQNSQEGKADYKLGKQFIKDATIVAGICGLVFMGYKVIKSKLKV